MKKLIAIALLTIVSTVSAFAQMSKDEQEILKIHASLDEAFMKKDITVFERVFADDYFMSSASGKLLSRTELMADLRKEMANTEYKMLSAATDSLKARTSGNMGFITGNWSSASVPANDTNAEPHKDTGRYTGIYEKRNGKWLVVSDQCSEAPHDRKLMEAQVLKMGLAYAQMIKNNDAAAIEKIFADEYIYTDYDGKVKNKTEDLAAYKEDRGKLESVEISDQKVLVISNTSAVETGTVRFKGTDKDGKAFDVSERYTTTWVWRTGRWQIVSDHVSAVK